MRPLRAFRPRLSDNLEARAVPATLGVVVPSGVLGLNVTLPTQVPVQSSAVQAAFTAFDQSYIDAVDNILLAPNANGLIVPSANRTSFNSAIDQSLETLAEQLVQSVSTTTTSTVSTSVSDQIVAAIVGTSPTSLESQLLALSTTTIELNLANVTSTGSSASSTVVANTVTTAEVVRATTPVPVAESVDPATVSTSPVSTSSASSTPSTQAANDVRSAFGTFLNDYFQAVQNTLMAPSATGQVNPSANRAAFDSKVNQALQTLETQLSTTLARYPSTTALGPRVQAAIDGNNASSLKSQLAKLTTPSGDEAAVVRSFTLGSTQAIARVLSLISGDVSQAMTAGN